MPTHLIEEYYKKLEALLRILDRIYSTNLNDEISNHLSLLKAIESNLNSFARMKPEEDQGIGRSDRISSFHFQNLDVLKSNFVSVRSESRLNTIINEFRNEIDQFLENTPEVLTIEYPLESFQVLKEYPLHIRALYRFELEWIRLSRVFLKSANFFRRLFKMRQKQEENRILRVYFK